MDFRSWVSDIIDEAFNLSPLQVLLLTWLVVAVFGNPFRPSVSYLRPPESSAPFAQTLDTDWWGWSQRACSSAWYQWKVRRGYAPPLLFRDDIAMWADTVYEIVETWQYGAVPLVLAVR